MVSEQSSIVPVTRERLRGRKARKIARGLTLPLSLVVLWWAIIEFNVVSSPLTVTIFQVGEAAYSLSESGELWRALGQSLLRNFAGFSIGSSIGLVVGVLIGMWPLFRYSVAPSLHAIKHVSMFAWIPLIMTWFGIGETSRLVFISVSAFFPVVLNTIEGVGSVPRHFVEVAKVMKFSRWQIFSRLILPSALPSIFTGIYLALIYSWLSTLGAEYLLTSSEGVGNILTEGRDNLWIDQVIVGIVLAGAVGFVLNWIAGTLEARLLRWRTASMPNTW